MIQEILRPTGFSSGRTAEDVMTGGTFRNQLVTGETVVGPMQIIDSMMVSEIIGVAGMDFVIFDQEHGPLGAETTQQLVAGAQGQGLSTVVRTRSNRPEEIQRALDIGADGVQVPQIETREEAEQVVEAARFGPQGSRGLSEYVRAGDYHGHAQYTGRQNERVAVIVQVEGTRGVSNVEEILAVDGIDVVFLGPYDLSQSLGVPSQVNHEKVESKILDVCDTAEEMDTAVGIFVNTVSDANRWIEAGVTYITLGVVGALLTQHLTSIQEQVTR